MFFERFGTFHPNHIVIGSFLCLILLGTVLLSLPVASSGDSVSPIDALFTSTSAVCVSGLTVLDTGGEFSRFGQVVTMILLQLGGLGIATFSTFFILVSGRRLSLRGRGMLESTLTQFPVKNMRRLLVKIVALTLAFEAAGTVVLYFFLSRSGTGSPVGFSALYHSISAFCNAGFSLYSTSMEAFRENVGVNAVIITLVLLGGIGFVVIVELSELFFSKHKPRRRLSLHSKVVLSVTALLLVAGTVSFLALERDNSLAGLSPGKKLLVSFFQAVTPRTAGFNTVTICTCTNATLFFLIALMFIGASPGSCGGGIKTTSFGVLVGLAVAKLRGPGDVNFFSRRVPDDIVSRAVAVAFFSMLVIIVVLMTLLITEPVLQGGRSGERFLSLLFEVVSAFGTVGLSTGVTPFLSTSGKLLLTIVMLVGRLGPLTIVIALTAREARPGFRYAEERLMIG